MQDPVEERRKKIKQAVVYAMIPFALAVPPIVGWFIGTWLDKLFGTAPVLMYINLAIGFVAGVREVIRIIKEGPNL